jgi:predicted LPLAT superfamily acyltransferase
VLKVPVSLAFGLYRGGNRYDLVFETFSEGLDIPRRDRAAAIPSLICSYAARLEHYVQSAPYNWVNFYDFWGHSDDATRTRHDARQAERAVVAMAPGRPSAAGDAALRGDRPGEG